MLKVVGASIEQTRASSYVLATLAICGIVVIIFGGRIASVDDDDGIYSATVYWKDNIGYRIEFWGQGNSLEEIPKGSARAYYKPDLHVTGWSNLEIETNEFDPDWVQAYSAGLLEGSLTWQHIYWHWQNTVYSLCENAEEECDKIREIIKKNSETIRTRAIKLSEVDSFWHQVRLFYAQLDGLENGWRYAVKSSRQNYEISSEDFLLMNIASDIVDISRKLKFSLVENSSRNYSTLTSAVFKLTNVSSEPAVNVVHSTAAKYSTMSRIVKRYNFNYHLTGSRLEQVVPGNVVTFTSYPGVISSLDDFYIVDSMEKVIKHRLTVTGTPLNIFNNNVWKKLNFEEQVFTSVRVMVANRLATSGRIWSRIFSHHVSGTNNKQWVVLNMHKLNAIKRNGKIDGLLWVIEQIPGLIIAADMSETFSKNSLWTSFGDAYFNDIKEVTKFQISSNFSAEKLLLENCSVNCSTIENILKIVRFGVRPNIAPFGARRDLFAQNASPYGIIDSKSFTGTLKDVLDLKLVSGPVYTVADQEKTSDSSHRENIPPFVWSSSKFSQLSHVGQPDKWEFAPFRLSWVWT